MEICVNNITTNVGCLNGPLCANLSWEYAEYASLLASRNYEIFVCTFARDWIYVNYIETVTGTNYYGMETMSLENEWEIYKLLRSINSNSILNSI